MKPEIGAASASDDVPIVRAEPFESFYSRQWRSLLALALAVSPSRSAAEDLVQDSLIVAYRDWERVQRLDDPEAWVRRILLNKAASVYRRRMTEIKALRRLSGRPHPPVSPDLPGAVESIWTEVRRLPKRQVQVIALRFVEGLTLEEIGSVLGCSKESVNTHLRRARARLNRRLDLEDRP